MPEKVGTILAGLNGYTDMMGTKLRQAEPS